MATLPTTREPQETTPFVQRIVSILWPSFITAALGTIVFFALFDPKELAELRNINEFSRLAGYTLGFFGFWLLTSISSALTCYFRRPCYKQPVPHYPEEDDLEQ